MATPLFASPDEHTHAIRAVSVARGQILGKKTSTAAVTEVRAPKLYAEVGDKVNCFSFKPSVVPTCMGPFEGSLRMVPSHTYVGRYDPVYYGLVGLPSLLTTDDTGVYLMRLLSAAISAALVTMAVLAARRAVRPSLALLGIAFSLTPMVLFLGGSVNPNGMEISAAICLWTAGLVAVDPARRTTAVIVYAAIGASVLAVSRGLSVLWLACILGLIALAAVRRPRRTLLQDRRMVIAGAVVGAVTLAALAWIVLTGALAVLPVGEKISGPFQNLIVTILGRGGRHLEEMVGWLQYFDVRLPFFTYVVWFVGVGALVVLAVVTGARRAWMAVVACLGLTLLSPLLELPSVRTTGLIWQGRYALPLAVGIPILAARAVAAASVEVITVLRRLALLFTGMVGLALVAAFYWAARRNAVGVDGALAFFGREQWQAPVPAWFLTLLFTGAVGVLVAWFWRSARDEADSPPEAVPAPDEAVLTAPG